jgi:hypothetical protein
MNAVYGGWQELLNSKSSLPGRCPWPLRSVARLVGVFVVVSVRVCHLLVVCEWGLRFCTWAGSCRPFGSFFLMK